MKAPSLVEYAVTRGHHKYDWYFPVYDAAIGHLAEKRIRLLEIGASRDSIAMWLTCFPRARVVALDSSKGGPTGIEALDEFRDERFAFVHGRQEDEALLRALGRFDVVIDDGGHRTSQQRKSFEVLFPLMPSGGWYFVEDLHTSYMVEYVDTVPTTVGFVQALLDDLHARWRCVDRVWDVEEVRMVDSLVAFKRGGHGL